jgi:porin
VPTKVAFDQKARIFLPQTNLNVQKANSAWDVVLSVDQYLWQNPENLKQGWGVFGNFGVSDGNPSPIKYSVTAGLGGNNPWSVRSNDQFGLGYYYMDLSNSLKNSLDVRAQFPRIAAQFSSFGQRLRFREEQGFEFFYTLALTGWLRFTADVQVIDPFAQSAETATFLGVRAKIDF